MEYFYGNPLSIAAEILSQRSKLCLSPLHLLEIRMLPSFKSFLTCQSDSKKKMKLLEDDKYLSQFVLGWYKDLQVYFFNFFVSFNWFLTLIENTSLKMNRYKMYLLLTRSDFHESEFFSNAMKIIKYFSSLILDL